MRSGDAGAGNERDVLGNRIRTTTRAGRGANGARKAKVSRVLNQERIARDAEETKKGITSREDDTAIEDDTPIQDPTETDAEPTEPLTRVRQSLSSTRAPGVFV